MKTIFVAFISVFVICGIGLFVRIVFYNPSVGGPTTNTQVLIKANQQSLEMVKWTVSTILLVGGGLIGLNWYQNESRVKEELNRFGEKEKSLREQLSNNMMMLEATRTFFMERELETQKSIFDLRREMKHTTLSFFGYGKDMDEGAAIVRMLEENPLYPPFVIDCVSQLLDFLERQDMGSQFSSWLYGRSLPQIAEHMARAKRPDLLARVNSLIAEADHSSQ